MAAVRRHQVFFLAFLLSCGALLFLTPANFFVKGPLTSAYVNGLLVDYLLPKLYLGDIFLGTSILLGFLALFSFSQTHPQRTKQSTLQWRRLLHSSNSGLLLLGLSLTGLLFLAQLGSAHTLVASSQLVRLVAMSVLGVFFYRVTKAHNLFGDTNTRTLLVKGGRWILFLAVLLTFLFQSTLALYQTATQHELLGYVLLGEPHLTAPLGIVRQTMTSGKSVILPYGSTAHPNVLAGCVVFFGLFAAWLLPYVQRQTRKQPVFVCLLGLISLFVVYLTGSVSAFLTLLVGWSMLLLQRGPSPKGLSTPSKQTTLLLLALLLVIGFVVAPLLLTTVGETMQDFSIQRRTVLQAAAKDMFLHYPLTGVRLEHFPAFLERFSHNQETVRFLQPVHNVFWLWLTETGILGVAAVITWVAVLAKKLTSSELFAFFLGVGLLLPIAVLDHYLLSLANGILLTGWVLIFAILLLPKNDVKT